MDDDDDTTAADSHAPTQRLLREMHGDEVEDLRKQNASLTAALEDKREHINTLRTQLTATKAQLVKETTLREEAERDRGKWMKVFDVCS
jgi:hypothetical protein